MGFDMVTALGRATAEGHTLFGHNAGNPLGASQRVRLTPGRPFEAGERIPTRYLELPQVRHTFTVLGTSAGSWGYQQGVNEQGVAIGRVPLRTRLACTQPGLLGDELVRLTLERAHSARHAVDLLTDFIRRHGQGPFPGAPADAEDSGFLIADAAEAFVVETAGTHFVWQQVLEQRVLGPLGTVRQDWDWISPGLSEHVIGQGWWPGDGSKIDFAGSVCPPLTDQRVAARRWGQLTRFLSEQTGHIDVSFVRRLLSDNEEDGNEPRTPSLIVNLSRCNGRPLIVWTALGPNCIGLYFPLVLEGELPVEVGASDESSLGERLCRLAEGLNQSQQTRDVAREAFDRLQARFDQEADEFAAEAAGLRQTGQAKDVARQGTLFMQHCLERFEEVADGLLGQRRAGPHMTRVAQASPAVLDIFEG